MLLLLRRSRSRVVADGLDAGANAPAIAQNLASSLWGAIASGRVVSRAGGLARAGTELRSLQVVPPPLPNFSADDAVMDAFRSKRAADSYAARWLRKAEELKDVKAASAETAGSLERTAVTESSEAFNTGRAKYLRLVSSTHLLKIWDAELDALVCEICAGADGTIVGINEFFPQGTPGAVHPYCRCIFSIISAIESVDYYDIAA